MELHWDGLINARDLGGSEIATGVVIKPGRLVRSGSPHTLSESGWRQLQSHGIRTVVNLMLDREIAGNPPLAPEAVPDDVTATRAQLEPDGYVEDWVERGEQWQLGTPHYYDDFVARYPERLVMTLNAVADAGEGGVLVHCRAGRDRCGLAIAMILDLVGVDHATIAADHWRSYVDETTATDGAAGLLEGRRLHEAEHAEAIHRLLDEHPAAGCFASTAQAEAVRAALVARLV